VIQVGVTWNGICKSNSDNSLTVLGDYFVMVVVPLISSAKKTENRIGMYI
jgi:hypothetical protein